MGMKSRVSKEKVELPGLGGTPGQVKISRPGPGGAMQLEEVIEEKDLKFAHDKDPVYNSKSGFDKTR